MEAIRVCVQHDEVFNFKMFLLTLSLIDADFDVIIQKLTR